MRFVLTMSAPPKSPGGSLTISMSLELRVVGFVPKSGIQGGYIARLEASTFACLKPLPQASILPNEDLKRLTCAVQPGTDGRISCL
jgi:hypothetical protein